LSEGSCCASRLFQASFESSRRENVLTRLLVTVFAVLPACLLSSKATLAQPLSGAAPVVHVIYMGGADCPPCVAWRMEELPKLKATREFPRVKFSFVEKVVRSPVPPRLFLPAEVRPFKEKLDYASSGRSGSPQVAIVVDGEVFDYFHGTRTAHEYSRMLAAILDGNEYPFKRCVKVSRQWRECEIPG